MPIEITPRDLATRLRDAAPPLVLDVREPQEIAVSAFPGALSIPMNDIPGRTGELPRDREIVVLCHHGMRSAQVAGFLARQGFEGIANLTGGIDAWSLQVDPSVPRY